MGAYRPLQLDYLKIQREVKGKCGPHGCAADDCVINSEDNVFGRIYCDKGLANIDIFFGGKLSAESEERAKRVLNYAVASLSRQGEIAEEGGNSCSLSRVEEWIKRKLPALRKWANRYQWKKGRVRIEWLTSKSDKIETFISVDREGLLHVHSVMAYPDFDIPESGISEIVGLAEIFHDGAEDIINARHEYWRKEERDGRI